MTNEISPTVDLIKDSLTHLLTVSFGKSTSPSYQLALNVAKGASKYDEIKVGGNIAHLVAFDKNREDAARALFLLHYISDWKTTQIYGGGKLLQTFYRVSNTLRCYLEATACDDWRAHCHTIIDDPFYESADKSFFELKIVISAEPAEPKNSKMIDRYIFPCSMLQRDFHHRTKEHPSNPIHQIQAEAISIGCDLCPFFDPKEYKKVGEKQKLY
jgi:hypothetical protein